MPPRKRRRQVENQRRKKNSLKVREVKIVEGESICGIEGEKAEQRSLSDLPRQVKEYIFAKLPLQSISRSRLVCKEWNSILSSCSFMSSLPEYNPWLLLWAEEYCMAYCFSTQKWMKISLSFLPAPVKENSCVYKYSSAELGLILLETPDLFICNPLTKDYAQIERDAIGTVIGIVQGQRAGEPYLVVNLGSCYDLQKFSIRVYHYFQDSWRIKFEFAEKKNFDIYPYIMHACNGFLFFAAKRPIFIAGYSIGDASIKPLRVAALPRHILEDDNVYQFLMVAYGLSILVIVMTEDSINAMIILELFQDDKDELLWKWREFATMPSVFLPSYFKKRYGHFVVVGDYLCFSRRNGKFAEGVAYHLKEGFWQCLPHLPDFKYSMVSSFQPKLKMKGGQSSFCTIFR